MPRTPSHSSTAPAASAPNWDALRAENAALRQEMQHLCATLSHDLRAPLRHIVSYTQLVREEAGEALSPDVHGFLDTITQSSQRLGGMLEALLAFSRAGTVALVQESVALSALVQEVCTSLQARHEERAIAWNIQPELPTLQADPTQLRQVLHHVLDNAVKFTQTQSAATIDIHTQPSPQGSYLVIRDNGSGFALADHTPLFTPFTRLHNNPALPGHGMGLAIARKLLERMGMRIHAESQVQMGCAISIAWNTSA